MANEQDTPNLDELRRELEAVGMVVVPFGDEIHIRRSTLEYIKVRVDDGVLHCEPRIGVMSMSRATWVLLAIEFVEMLTVTRPSGASLKGLLAVFVGLLAFGIHALRYTLADITISRVQAIWLDLRARHRVTAGLAPAPLASPTTGKLAEGSPSVRPVGQSHHARTPV